MAATNTEKPWVSILTPVANGWEFLEECAMSVFLQERSDVAAGTRLTWEWWIGVNGHGESGGPALEVARKIKGLARVNMDGDNVHVVNLPHARGKVEAMNALAGLAKGEWVAVLDCDDTWRRNKLIVQKQVVEQATVEGIPAADAGVIGTWCSYFGSTISSGPDLPYGWIEPRSLRHVNPLINSSVILKRELAVWEDRCGLDDYDLWIRLSKRGVKMLNIPLRLVHHRIHAESAFNSKGKQDVAGLLDFHFKEAEAK